MKLVEVLIEYPSMQIDRPFSYAYDGDDIQIGVRVLVPFNKQEVVGYVLAIKDIISLENESVLQGREIKSITKVLDEEPILNEELMKLASELKEYYFAPLISIYQTMLPPSLKPKSSSLSKPKIAYDTYVKVKDENILLTKKQEEVFLKIKESKESLKNLYSANIIKTLLDKGAIEEVKKEKRRLKTENIEKKEENTLSDEQQDVLTKILENPRDIYLLEGVTGSGKTEVYLQLTKKMIEMGKKVLILVPEISLSYQMIHQFEERFSSIAILHSSLTPGEKYDEYRLIARGEIDIVIGARSAIFAPLDNIGMIIIDEEHSETYKQESPPYYHALTVAKMRMKYHSCGILLGSATPSLESRSRAYKGVYHLLTLNNRITGHLPTCQIVSLSDYKEIDKESILFSKTARKAIQETLDKHEQVMILLNRRGFAPSFSCRKCGHIFRCKECHLPLTLHKDVHRLKCHHCGYEEDEPDICPSCSSTYFRINGYGSERAEEEVKKLFPSAKILRLDSDVSSKKGQTKSILKQFKNQEADILLGTQMIAKGHDFKNVTLAIVLLADIGLNLPSFRAAERTFSLLTQTIGRAGRSKNGLAILQTYNPTHYALKYASKQDYEGFYNHEMKIRKMNMYPPFCYCTILTLSSANEELLDEMTLKIKTFLNASFEDKAVEVIGPSEYYIRILNRHYRKKFLLKYKSFEDIKDVLLKLQDIFKSQRGVQCFINVDPYEDY